jgi:hypothetical protein
MAKLRCKGTVLKVTVATVLTPIAQIVSFDFGDFKSETTEVDTLDNADAGIPKMNTGRADGGKVSGELFFDPALASHTAFYGLVSTPPTTETACTVEFTNSPKTTMSYNAVGFGLSGQVALKEGLKGKFEMEISKLPTFATGS